MRKIFHIFLFILFHNVGFGQNLNLIIQVNDDLIYAGELSHIYLSFDVGKENRKIEVDYVPGELILDENAWSFINSDTINNFTLYFDYHTYPRNKIKTANFHVDLNKVHFEQPYLILNIYDFRDRRYKKWYDSYTDENFLAELTMPNSGIYIRKK